jgi:putative ABC transport system substrate-binding protein
MKRRELMLIVGGAAIIWPFAGHAQQKAMPVIGLLSPLTPADTEPWHRAFRQGLGDLGWVPGANLRLEYRYSNGRNERLPELAAELIKLKVDLIVVTIATDANAAAKATKTIPIVMASHGDPIATGLIASLARPGGNVTGLTQMSTDLAAKRLQLLQEVAPGMSRVAVLWNPESGTSVPAWEEIQGPARQMGIELHSLEVRRGGDFDAAFASVIEADDHAVMVLPSGPIFVVNQQRIADFAAKHRLPLMVHSPESVRAGGLLAYGPDRADLFRRAATYVDKILKGAKPADLPVQQPTKFELVINLKTAAALGLTVPQALIARADEVIE